MALKIMGLRTSRCVRSVGRTLTKRRGSTGSIGRTGRKGKEYRILKRSLSRCARGHSFSGITCPQCRRDQRTIEKWLRAKTRTETVLANDINRKLVELLCPKRHRYRANVSSLLKRAQADQLPYACPHCKRSTGRSKDGSGSKTTKAKSDSKKTKTKTTRTERRPSKGELLVAERLRVREIPFFAEYTIPEAPGRFYDFFFRHDRRKYLLEYDGRQHFERVKIFHPNEQTFKRAQEVDRFKTNAAIKGGFCIIRLDHTVNEPTQVDEHLDLAFKTFRRMYLSNPDMYRYLHDYDLA